MKSRLRKHLLWVFCASLILAVLATRFGRVYSQKPVHSWEEQELSVVEDQLNEYYRAYRPFPYRWCGAPYSSQSPGTLSVPVKQLGLLLGNVERIERFAGRNARSLRLKARIRLVAGKYDAALQDYHLAEMQAFNAPALDLEVGIAYAQRAKAEDRALDYERALESVLMAERSAQAPEALFDAALLFEEIPVPQQAAQEWQRVLLSEPSPEWRREAETRLARLTSLLEKRAQLILDLTGSPDSYLRRANNVPGADELVEETALENWLTIANQPGAARKALDYLAANLKNERHDEWLSALLKDQDSREATVAFQFLSKSVKANSEGNHLAAGQAAIAAEHLFRRLHNPAGILRARVEWAYSLDRRWRPEDCLSALAGVRSAAHEQHFTWIEGQSWLEEITCRTETRRAEVIGSREDAYQWISNTGYEDLRLRSMSFLTEAYGGIDSRLQVWRWALHGLKSFWDNPLSARRGYTFYFTLADSAQSGGDHQAALVLLKEGAHTLESYPNRQLLALVLSYLGARQLEAHLDHDAERTFEKMEALFQHLPKIEIKKFYRMAQIIRAEANLRTNRPADALRRLKAITQATSFPYDDFGATERRQLLPVLGNAFLASGQLSKALRCYRQIILENRNDLRLIRDHGQRDAAQREIAAAWRGMTEILVRQHKFSEALEGWEAFRDGRLRVPPISVRPPSGVVFLAYAMLPGGLSGWLADSHGIQHQWLDESVVKRYAARFATLASDPESPPAALKESSQNLYRAIIQPFSARLHPGRLLVIDPDSELAAIPWAALQDERGTFLLERFPISQAVGWRQVLAHINAKKVDFSQSVILGAPSLGAEAEVEYGPQTDSLRDARAIHKLIPNAIYQEGENVTLDQLIKLGPRSSMLYFAGHGVSHGGFGALLLAKSSDDKRPFAIMTAEELSNLRLERLQLVTLAACSSGAGEQSGIVDLESLVRGFLEAGAFRVIAARWNVNSQETSEMMLAFHRQLLAGKRPAEALQAAAIRAHQNSPDASPFFWAGFQVFGEP